MKVKRVEHVAIAVKGLAGMSAILTDLFGVECEYEEDFPDHHVRIAMFPVGDTYLELLDGYAPEAGASKWLAQRGQSLFHLCLEVEDIDAALRELKAKNVKLIHEEPITGHGGSRVAFVDPSATGDILFELVQMHA